MHSYRPWDSEERKARKIAKSPMHEMGYRVTGFLCDLGKFDKKYGKSLTMETRLEAFEKLFHGDHELRQSQINLIINQIQHLIDAVKQIDSWRFWATSLLIVFDDTPKAPCVRVIDFSNAYSISAIQQKMQNYEIQNGVDENYLEGLSRFSADLRLFCQNLKQTV